MEPTTPKPTSTPPTPVSPTPPSASVSNVNSDTAMNNSEHSQLLSELNSTPAAPQPQIMPDHSAQPAKPSKSTINFKELLGKWYIWAMLGCLLFAIFGISFAAYTLSENAKAEDKIAQLEKELDEKNQLLVKYGAQLGQIVGDSSRPGYQEPEKDDDNNENPATIASSDYIYIGEWGIKLRIPEGLKNVSYRFSNFVHQDGNSEIYPYDKTKTVCVSAILDEMDYTPESFSILNNSFGCLTQLKESDADQFTPEEIVKIDDEVFRYKYPEDIRSISTNEQEQNWGTKIIPLVQQMLTNPDNISKF